MTFRADLHTHSSFSDGTDSPETLIQLALDTGLSGLSITDHDTIAAYAEALPIAKEKGLLLLPGVEFSSASQVHVLGYAFNLKSEAIADLCARHKTRRLDRNLKILEKLKGLGIRIEIEELGKEGHTVGRPHIAQALINRGQVETIQEAFDRYLGEGKPAFDPGEQVTTLETIEVIHKAGGKAVIAHPHLLKRSTLIRQLLQMPFDGLEGYYARFSPSQEKKWINTAEDKGWLTTGGSDYHGSNKPFNFLGSSWVGKETFDLLYAHYLAQNP